MCAGVSAGQIPHTVPQGTAENFTFRTGNDLLRYCQSEQTFDQGVCGAYIIGAVDLIGYVSNPPLT